MCQSQFYDWGNTLGQKFLRSQAATSGNGIFTGHLNSSNSSPSAAQIVSSCVCGMRGKVLGVFCSTDGKIENYEQKGKTFVCVCVAAFSAAMAQKLICCRFQLDTHSFAPLPLHTPWLLATLLVRGSFSILFMALQVQVNMCDKRPHEAQWQSFILAKLLNKNASLLLYWNLSCVACSWTGCPVSDSSAGHLSLREIERRVIDGAGTETETEIGTARDCGWDRHSEIKRLAAVSAGNRLILSSFSTH